MDFGLKRNAICLEKHKKTRKSNLKKGREVHQELNSTLPTATTNSTNSHKEAGKNALSNAERSKTKHFSKPIS